MAGAQLEVRHVHPDVARAGDFIVSVDLADAPGRDRLARGLLAAQRAYEVTGEIVVTQVYDGPHRAGGWVWAFYRIGAEQGGP